MALGKDLRVFVLSLRSTFGDRRGFAGRVSRFRACWAGDGE